MSDSNTESLREKLEDGKYTIEVKETIRRGTKLALNKHGERTLTKEENEQLRSYLDRYKDLIIEIEKTGSDLEGFEKAWNLGRLMVEAKKEADEAGEEFVFADLVPAISAFQFSRSLAYRYRLLYKMFPSGQYDSDYSHTTLAEMAQRADTPEDAREPYRRVKEAGVKPTEDEVRAWGDSTADLESIARAVTERTKNGHIKSIQTVALLHGLDPLPTDEEIKEVLESLDIN